MARAPRTAEPILVTGMPRSGTTWLARLLATAPSTALTGREPMNPRGRQYALAGTLPGWARLDRPTGRQRLALRTSYRGVNPLVYSRYGYRQWAAPLPGVRLVIKDPFAMLSMPAVRRVTKAVPILLFRHPGAALTSYRRMGWSPDLLELEPIVTEFLDRHGPTPGVTHLPAADGLSEVRAMAWFWNVLYGMAVHDAGQLDEVVVLAHHDLATRGEAFCRELFGLLGLRWSAAVSAQLVSPEGATAVVDITALHNFDRPPAHVAQEWTSKVTAAERELIELETQEVRSLLVERAFGAGVSEA